MIRTLLYIENKWNVLRAATRETAPVTEATTENSEDTEAKPQHSSDPWKGRNLHITVGVLIAAMLVVVAVVAFVILRSVAGRTNVDVNP